MTSSADRGQHHGSVSQQGLFNAMIFSCYTLKKNRLMGHITKDDWCVHIPVIEKDIQMRGKALAMSTTCGGLVEVIGVFSVHPFLSILLCSVLSCCYLRYIETSVPGAAQVK